MLLVYLFRQLCAWVMERCLVPLVRILLISRTVPKCTKTIVINTCNFHQGINRKQGATMNHCNICSELSNTYLQNSAKICNIALCKLGRKNFHIISNNNCNIMSNCDSFQTVCDIHNKIKARFHLGSKLTADTANPTFDKGKSNTSDSAGSDSDADDPSIKPVLDAVTPNTEPPHYVNIVPGKGPPPEPPVDCCMSGCANCVWIQYCEELKRYFSGGVGQEIAKQAIESIENEGLKMFLKLELGFLD